MLELEKVWPLLGIYAILDCLQYTAAGGIRAAGKQGLAAISTWITYGVLALLISWVAAFKMDLGLSGIWIGPMFALLLNFGAYVIIWVRIDWETLFAASEAQREKDKSLKESDEVEQ